VRISATFDCDFADLFEARGQRRPARGVRAVSIDGESSAEFVYTGLDGVTRGTRLDFAPFPDGIESSFAYYDIRLKPHEKRLFFVRISCNPPAESEWSSRDFFVAFAEARRALRRALERPLL